MADCPHTIGVEFGTRIIEVETLFGFQVCEAKCVSGVRAEDKATDLGHCWPREVIIANQIFVCNIVPIMMIDGD